MSILKMVQVRERLQAGTSTHSERAIALNPKFYPKVSELNQGTETVKLGPNEASHRIRIAQDQNESLQRQMRQTAARVHRWQETSKGILKVVHDSGEHPPTS